MYLFVRIYGSQSCSSKIHHSSSSLWVKVSPFFGGQKDLPITSHLHVFALHFWPPLDLQDCFIGGTKSHRDTGINILTCNKSFKQQAGLSDHPTIVQKCWPKSNTNNQQMEGSAMQKPCSRNQDSISYLYFYTIYIIYIYISHLSSTLRLTMYIFLGNE